MIEVALTDLEKETRIIFSYDLKINKYYTKAKRDVVAMEYAKPNFMLVIILFSFFPNQKKFNYMYWFAILFSFFPNQKKFNYM